MESPTLAPERNLYLELKEKVAATGLMQRSSRDFFVRFVGTSGLLLISVYILGLTTDWRVQALNAIFLSFVYGQFGLLGHDAGHMQLFKKRWKNMAGCHLSAFMTGLSANSWLAQHNAHHADPNHEDLDPDVHIPVLAFNEDQARNKKGLLRWVVRHQVILFFLLLCFTAWSIQFSVIAFFINRGTAVLVDIALWALHHLVYLFVIFTLLPAGTAIMFILLHQFAWGLYMGAIFAPNHKGMKIIGRNEKIDYLSSQVLTARNVKANWWNNYWYGGLNFQVEHHLFPFMPRTNLAKVQPIVKQFCAEHGVYYHEVGVVQSYREILAHLSETAKFAKA